MKGEGMEKELRAKLDELTGSLAFQYGRFLGGIDDASERAIIAVKLDQVTEIRDWLDSLPDSWHDLAADPEDLPEQRKSVWLVHTYKGEQSFCGKLEVDCIHWDNGWIDTGNHDPLEWSKISMKFYVPIAWKYCEEKPETPAHFKSKEKV